VAALNRVPRDQHGVDIMRVREWYLSGHSSHYRQTVLLSSYGSPAMAALAAGCANHAGALRCVPLAHDGMLGAVVPQVQQLFERFRAATPADASAARVEFFKRAVWPRIKEACMAGLLVFVPSYFDYVRCAAACPNKHLSVARLPDCSTPTLVWPESQSALHLTLPKLLILPHYSPGHMIC